VVVSELQRLVREAGLGQDCRSPQLPPSPPRSASSALSSPRPLLPARLVAPPSVAVAACLSVVANLCLDTGSM